MNKFQITNSNDFQFISDVYPTSKQSKDDAHKRVIVENMGRVGDGIDTLGNIMTKHEIESWQKELFEMEDMLENLEDNSESLLKNLLGRRGEIASWRNQSMTRKDYAKRSNSLIKYIN